MKNIKNISNLVDQILKEDLDLSSNFMIIKNQDGSFHAAYPISITAPDLESLETELKDKGYTLTSKLKGKIKSLKPIESMFINMDNDELDSSSNINYIYSHPEASEFHQNLVGGENSGDTSIGDVGGDSAGAGEGGGE